MSLIWGDTGEPVRVPDEARARELTTEAVAAARDRQTTARQARINAGLTIVEAAYAVRRSPRYIASREANGGWSYWLASTLARLYGCGLEAFLQRPGETRRPPAREKRTAAHRTDAASLSNTTGARRSG